MNEINQLITMQRENLDEIPVYELPSGYILRTCQSGDENSWVTIHVQADLFNTITSDLYHRNFGYDRELLAARQYYLCKSNHEVIGTATAWFDDDFMGQRYGRVHWVAIVPEYQGQGLAKPLMTAVCHRLQKLGHKRAILDTSSVRIPAINLYLKFGFEPLKRNAEETAVWQSLLTNISEKI